MADKRISELPYLGNSGYTTSDIIPIVNYFDNLTGDTKNTPIEQFKDYVLSGVSDFFVTGGTYDNITGTITLDRQDGFVTINGLYTGETSYVNSLTTGSGLSANTATGDITIINTDPDQVVSISGGTGILTGGTYPNFTIENTLPDQVVSISGGTNVNVTGLYPNFTIDITGLTDNNTYTTGFTYQDNTFTISDSSGNTISTTIDIMTGLTVNGVLSATTISGGTFYGDGSNLTGVGGVSFSQTNNYTSGVPITITHNLNTTEVLVQIVDTNTNELIFGNINNYQLNSLNVTLSSSLNGIRVVVIGGLINSITPTGSILMLFGHDSVSPVDSTTYYIGGQFNLAAVTSPSDGRRLISPVTGSIVQVSISRTIGGTLGSSETNTFTIENVTQATSSTITTTATFNSSSSLINYILSSPLSVVNGDRLEISLSTPVYATNPTAVRQQINVLINF